MTICSVRRHQGRERAHFILLVLVGSSFTAQAQLNDNFNSSLSRGDLDPQYGLNQGLLARQSGVDRGVTYTRVSGSWNNDIPPQAWFSQVNHPLYPGKLMFTSGLSAVRLDSPLTTDANGNYSIGVSVDPVLFDTTSNMWASVMLSLNPHSRGFPTNSDIALGVTFRSNGTVQVWQRGVLKKTFFVAASAIYQVKISSNINFPACTVLINGREEKVVLDSALPSDVFVLLGSYPPAPQAISIFDNLQLSRVERDPKILYYGYWGAAGAGFGNHLEEISAYTNLNMIFPDTPQLLDSCAHHSCVVYAGWQFFPLCEVDGPCPLAPDAALRYANLINSLASRINKIAAIYIKDEPNAYGVSNADLDAAIKIVKSHPLTSKIPTMIIMAPTNLTSKSYIPTQADWIGVDKYCADLSDLESVLGTLDGLMTGKQRQFLVPESDLIQCPGETDWTLAVRQKEYFEIARHHPSVVGIMNFRNWMDPSTVLHPLTSLPMTMDQQQRFGNAVLFRAGRQ